VSAARDEAPGAEPRSEWIAVGQVMGAFGSTGELRVKPLGRFPDRFRELKRVYLGEEHAETAVLHRRPHGEGVVMRLQGVKGRDEARALFGTYLYVPESEAVELPAGEFFVHQVVGLRVVTDEGRELGTVREVLQTGSNDVYVVRAPGTPEVLLPAIKDVVKRIDPEGGVIEVTLLPGLVD
jgi:16S rRNA processing protein RimM